MVENTPHNFRKQGKRHHHLRPLYSLCQRARVWSYSCSAVGAAGLGVSMIYNCFVFGVVTTERNLLQLLSKVLLTPHLVCCSGDGWPKPSCEAQWKGEEDKADRGRGGKTTSGNGQAWSSAGPRRQWRTGKIEKTDCEIICGASMTLAVKG